MSNKGIVYALTNPAQPGFVKIGKTTNLEKRIRQLNNTSVALPFECAYAVEVRDMDKTERLLHDVFDDRRPDEKRRGKREFFEIAPERAIAALKLTGGKEVVAEKNNKNEKKNTSAKRKASGKKPAFNFRHAKIYPDAIITYRDDDSITATVIDDTRIKFRGDPMSLKGATDILLKGTNRSNKVSGYNFWKYKGEILNKIRERLEADGKYGEGD